jgi:hypothetical protein
MKKGYKYLLVIVLLCVIVAFGFAAGKDTAVYVTKTGDKYHTAWCSYLRSSKIEITLEQAVSRGYGPCSRCKPPVLDKEE